MRTTTTMTMELQTPSSPSHSSRATNPTGVSITNNGHQSSSVEGQTGVSKVTNYEPIDGHDAQLFYDDADSACSTPYVSAPSSPGRGPVAAGFFYSAPASPMHFAITSVASAPYTSGVGGNNTGPLGYEFEFSARFGTTGSSGSGSMSSADELFLNGQIRPMKLSTHLERPQVLAPLLDLEVEDEDDAEVDSHARGRDLRLRNKSMSMRRRTRSMSPLRNNPFEWAEENDVVLGGMLLSKEETANKDVTLEMEEGGGERGKLDGLGSETTAVTTPTSISASSSRSSSAGRSSKRWVFLKDFLYRSKSEGRINNKFWSTISFSPVKDKRPTTSTSPLAKEKEKQMNQTARDGGSCDAQKSGAKKRNNAGKPTNGVGKRRIPPSPHEIHYKANRAQAEELRRKTFLPYRQGLLGCLGFTSKGYGALNGFARALNPVSSR